MQRIVVTLSVLLLAAPGVQAQADRAESPGDTTIEFTVAGMVCEGCADKAKRALESVSGVTDVKIEYATGSGTARLDSRVSHAALREALRAINMEILLPGETLSPPLTDEERAGLDIRTVSHGEKFDLDKALASGKVTIFDYYADWCAPCRILTPKLERLLLEYPDLALRKVDIVNWKTDVAKQATKEHALKALPFVVVYGKDGKLLGKVTGLRVDQVKALISKGVSS